MSDNADTEPLAIEDEPVEEPVEADAQPEEVVMKKPSKKKEPAEKKATAAKAAAKKAAAKKAAAKEAPTKKPAQIKAETAKRKQEDNKEKKEKKEAKKNTKDQVEETKKTETFAEKASKWKQQESQGTAEEGSSEGEGGEEGKVQTRDLAKARKWKRLQDQDAIPTHIMEMMKKEKSRAGKTAIINELFDKDGKGNLIMNCEKPQFKATKAAIHERFGTDQTIGKPRSVFLYSDFHGNKAALEESIADGTVLTWNQDGIPFCGYRTTAAGIGKKIQDKSKLDNDKEVSEDTYKALSKAFNTMSFTFGDDDEAGCGGPTSSSASSKQPEKAEFTESMKGLVSDAKSAMERLYGAAMKLLNKCSSVKDKEAFKPQVQKIKAWISKDDHLLTWSELQDGQPFTAANFQKFMKEQADEAISLNEGFEQFKALLRTRKEL